jgi:aspartate/methionine/tyrosine aminotransferase
MKAMQENKIFQLPRRLQGVQPTLIRRIFERALPESINFGLGEPDLPTPQFIREEAARVTLEEQNGYTNHAGIPALRELIAASYPHLNLSPNQVCVTVGSQEAMTAAFLGIVDAGDEVLIPNPSFPAYENCVRICEGEPVFYRLPAEKDFAFDIEEFKSKITPKTKAVVVISPSNPTGKIFTENDLRQIAEALKDTGIYLISDEIYSDLYFTDEKPRSASEFYDKTVIVSGLSKSLSMTGWRVGWACKLANRRYKSGDDFARISDRLHFDHFPESVAAWLDAGSRSRQSRRARDLQTARRVSY